MLEVSQRIQALSVLSLRVEERPVGGSREAGARWPENDPGLLDPPEIWEKAARWQVRLAAPLLLRTDPELALYGRYCVSRRLSEEGFAFEYPALSGALQDLFSPEPDAPAQLEARS